MLEKLLEMPGDALTPAELPKFSLSVRWQDVLPALFFPFFHRFTTPLAKVTEHWGWARHQAARGSQQGCTLYLALCQGLAFLRPRPPFPPSRNPSHPSQLPTSIFPRCLPVTPPGGPKPQFCPKLGWLYVGTGNRFKIPR